MVFLTEFTTVVTKDDHLNSPVFTVILLAIIFGWLLVSVFQRLLENFVYETLGLNSRSTIHALIVAILASIIFVAIIWMINEYKIVPKTEEFNKNNCNNNGFRENCEEKNYYENMFKYKNFGHPICNQSCISY